MARSTYGLGGLMPPPVPEGPPVRLSARDWRRIFHYLTRSWGSAPAIVFCLSAAAALGVVPGLLIRQVIDQAIPHRAHVALRDPRLIILDEATSSLDSRSEARVSEALKSLLPLSETLSRAIQDLGFMASRPRQAQTR